MFLPKLKFLCIFLYLTSLYAEARKGGCYHRQKKVRGLCVPPDLCPNYISDYAIGIEAQKCNTSTLCCAEKEIGKRSEEKCEEYRELGFEIVDQPTLRLFASDEDDIDKDSICPYETEGTTVIIGGEEADLGEFPHMALIGFDNGMWKCSGSLISPNFVLTAAHCIFRRGYGNASIVRLGDRNFTDPRDDTYVQDIPIKFVHKHPKYLYPSTYHDIVLFELEHAANLSIYVKPICVYTKSALPSQVLAAGWGDTNTSAPGENDMLMKVSLDVYNKNMCSEKFGKSDMFPNGFDDSIQLCVGSVGDIKDTCQGDSGGPIQLRSEVHCSYEIVGITSIGSGCGVGIPAVYVWIYPYIEWIESIIYA